jgi:hypothetical protein
MSANIYSVESLLVGKEYISRSIRGTIVRAEKHPHAVWYENAEAYLVELSNGKFRTLAVAN